MVPVTVTLKTPAADPVQESVEVPDPPDMLGGLRVHARPVLGDRVADKLTVPANPFTAATVMIDVPAVLTFTVTDVGLALIVKSWTVNVTVAL